ncbi:regulatory protein ToxS [Vibrio sp. SCSIO 43136]|uniref:regulatory protein ToxS n=1 Tax=Vibrio sp. SCSIO 43136 TaxID=2819101 RepID=UPI00207537F9|nr:regulatory protein ToxS [Vibrio sp. SCSIO 43136]USD64571.1 hypothetical protein J4N39_10710 [Vibrio sp. SCSIO 43136]
MNHNLSQRLPLLIVAASILICGWIYLGNDAKTERILTSREWQSKLVTRIYTEPNADVAAEIEVGPLRKATIDSNVKYLPNGNYLRVSRISLYSESSEVSSIINVSENGSWELSDNYLLIEPSEFKDISASQRQDFSEKQLKVITQIFKMDAQQSRRVDIINEKTLLMTSLDHGSNVLYSH